MVLVAIYGEEVEGVVGELFALFWGPLLGAFLPGVCEWDDVVDLDELAGVLSALEVDDVASEWVVECAGEDAASVWYVGVVEVALENVVALVAAVSVDVAPALAELVTVVSGSWCSASHGEGFPFRPYVSSWGACDAFDPEG